MHNLTDMKLIKIFILLTAFAALGACKGGESLSKEVSALRPDSAQRDSVSYLLGVVFGSYIKNYNIGEIDDIDFERLKEGVADCLSAKHLPESEESSEEFAVSPLDMTAVFERYLEKRYNFVKGRNSELEPDYLKKMEKEGFTRDESGFLYIITNPGLETHIKDLDTVSVSYKGYCSDGRVFSVSGEEPLTAVVKPEGLITEGWIKGLKMIGQGGQITLVLPAAMAYGEAGRLRVEPNQPVRVDIEVISVSLSPVPVKEESSELLIEEY